MVFAEQFLISGVLQVKLAAAPKKSHKTYWIDKNIKILHWNQSRILPLIREILNSDIQMVREKCWSPIHSIMLAYTVPMLVVAHPQFYEEE
ncbi:MAG: hypothetical protein Q9191_004309 [Dirinaria sp. TL-2023a]